MCRCHRKSPIRKKAKKRPGRCHEELEARRFFSVSWIGASGGSWSTASNWSGNTVPAAGDDVIINKAGSVKVNLTASTSIKSLAVTGDTLTISGGTLSIAASSSINANAVLSLTGSGAVSLGSSAALSNSGTIAVNALSQLNVGGAYTETSTGALNLSTGTFSSGIGTNLIGNGTFESPSVGTSTTTAPGTWGQWGSSYVSAVADHSGSQSLLQYGTNSGVYQSFAVSPGVSYSASVYALDPTIGGLTGSQGAFLQLSFTDANGDTLSTPKQFITALSSTSTTGSWINSTATITAPATAASIVMDLQVGGYTGNAGVQGGSIYWDDIQLGPTAINSAAVSAGSITNSGAITVGAGDTLWATTSFTQSTTGILNAQLGGPAAGNFFGSVNVGGAATLAGTLKATLVNSYSPSLNDGFSLVKYASETGGFTTVQLPSGSAYTFQPGVNPTYVGIGAVPVSLSTTINAASTSTTASTNLIGVNLALWDGYLNTAATQQIVEDAGLSLLRFPGGSGSDDYHFNAQYNYGYSSNTVPQFAQFISSVGATGMVTTDYGSGSPQEAEAELAYLEGSPTDTTTIGTGIEWSDSASAWQNVNWQTVGYWASLRAASPLTKDDGLNFMRINQTSPYLNIKYWEIGNELYGSWEDDNHGTAGPGGVSTGAQHDPATYAAFAAAFSKFDAADSHLPAVLVGIDSGDPTGAGDNNWTKDVLTDLYSLGVTPGYISDHSYEQQQGTENDSFLLNGTVSNSASILDWSTRYSDYKAMLQQVVGSTNAGTVQVLATEFNSNAGTEGKQMTSLVNGLFIADSIGSLLNSGYTGGLVWDLRNGWTSTGNNSPSLYGWRQGGDEGLIGSYNYVPAPSTGPYVAYPNYFAEQLASKFIQNGGADVSTVSNYAELTVYSVLEPNGHLELLVLNKNPDASLNEQFNLSGFTPSGGARLWQYGQAQDYAQSQTTDGAAALASSSLSLALTGNNFSYSFPAYSMSVIDLAPKLSVATIAVATPSPTVAGAVSLSVLGLENGSDTGLLYSWAATGPGAVSYSGATNGTNAAKNLVGTVTQAGVYSFVVTITDPGAQTITSSVQVTLPVIASQSGSTLTVNLNSLAGVNLAASGTSVAVSENGLLTLYSGVSAINVVGSATSSVFNFNGPLTTPFTFSNGATTTLNVNSGTLTIAAVNGSTINSQLFSTINLLAGANLVVAGASTQAGRTLLNTQYLNLAGTIGSWKSRLDLNGNDLEVTAGNYTNLQDQLAQGFNAAGSIWQGTGGIVSSQAAADSTHLATLGIIQNSVYGSANPFDNTSPTTAAVLVKYTYYGDVDLNGKVDGSDYSRIDSGYLNHLSGWFNGDFNYDGSVNGSDYTLMDNAFNTQGAALAAVLATPAAKVAAPAAVPIVAASTPLNDFASSSPFSLSKLKWIDQVFADLDG